MGKMLVNRLISFGNIAARDVYIATKTRSKLYEIKEKYQEISINTPIDEFTRICDIIFICVPPSQVFEVLKALKTGNLSKTHVISFASCVSIGNIESVIDAKISKIIPSFVSEVGEGVLLSCHNNQVNNGDKDFLESLLQTLGKIKEISENDIEIYTELTSCSPGIFSAIFQEFINSAIRHGNIKENDAQSMVIQTLFGLANLYKEKDISFDDTIFRVARKGGMTEIGVDGIRKNLPEIFDSIFEKTINAYTEKKNAINAIFTQEHCN